MPQANFPYTLILEIKKLVHDYTSIKYCTMQNIQCDKSTTSTKYIHDIQGFKRTTHSRLIILQREATMMSHVL